MMAPEWLDRSEYPFPSHWLDTGAGRMHFVDEGGGDPVVFVHGTPTWSFEWRHVIRELAGDYRCVAPDHIGFGLSDKPRGFGYRPADHARNFAGLMHHLGLRGVTLVVHDFGGPIGLSWAIDHPGCVKRLVVSNSWLWSLAKDRVGMVFSRLVSGTLGHWLYTRRGFSENVLLPGFIDRSKLPPHIHDHYRRVWDGPEEHLGTWILARELRASNPWYESLWQRRAELLHKPALLVWGLKDKAFGRQLARWQSALPLARTEARPDVGHFVPEEMGAGLGKIIREFIRST